jgi:cytochrome c oxidase accessory protein FixG
MNQNDGYKETLYTIGKDGHRKWVYPSLEKGAWFNKRLVVAYALIAFYLLMPWITIGGKQGIFLNFADRQFIFFGTTFFATDTVFLLLVLGFLAISLFFFTALFGRVWCGWACPETVFLEFVFRPIERLIEGNGAQRLRLDQQPWNAAKIRKKLIKHSICATLSWIIATTALAYIIGSEPLVRMILEGPHNHLTAFSITLILMGLMAFQFGWFREQFCTIVCPYARFQSVMMDDNSLVVGYDPGRGEPRGKLRKKSSKPAEETGDCVDCGLCVRVCPTGIDIRNGLQMECIACTACIDACDSIMDKVGKPAGLIRYDTENSLNGKATRFLRPRVFVYAFILAAFSVIFVAHLSTRALSEFQLIRGSLDSAFTRLNDGRISNHMHLRIMNKSDEEQRFEVSIEDPNFELVIPVSPFPVAARGVGTTPIFINFPQQNLVGGKQKVSVTVTNDAGFNETQEITVVGPGE